MRRLIQDFFIYPFRSHEKGNRFSQLMRFLIKQYPAFFREKPTFLRLLAFPFLLIEMIGRGLPKQGEAKISAEKTNDERK